MGDHVVCDLDEWWCGRCQRYLECEHTLSSPAGVGGGAAGARERLAHVKASLIRDGYCVLRSELDAEQSDCTFNAVRHFFQQPLAAKAAAISLDKARRGYSPLNTDNFASLTGHKKANDTVEKFRMGPLLEDVPPDELRSDEIAGKDGRVHFFPNTWPEACPQLQPALSAHYRVMEQLSQRLLRVLEVLFDLPTASLYGTLRRHTSIMGANAYLPLPADQLPLPSEAVQASSGQRLEVIERVAEHTDVSLFTIVADRSFVSIPTAGPASLCSLAEVKLQMFRTSAQCWADLPLPAHHYLVNMGECLQRWSGGRLAPARHRVVQCQPPPSSLPSPAQPVEAAERYSIAYFCTPGHRTVLQWPVDPTSHDGVACEDYSSWRKAKIKRTLQCIKQALKA